METNRVALLLQQWQERIWQHLPDVCSGIVILLLFWLVAALARRISNRLEARMGRKGIWTRWSGWFFYGFFGFQGFSWRSMRWA